MSQDIYQPICSCPELKASGTKLSISKFISNVVGDLLVKMKKDKYATFAFNYAGVHLKF